MLSKKPERFLSINWKSMQTQALIYKQHHKSNPIWIEQLNSSLLKMIFIWWTMRFIASTVDILCLSYSIWYALWICIHQCLYINESLNFMFIKLFNVHKASVSLQKTWIKLLITFTTPFVTFWSMNILVA